MTKRWGLVSNGVIATVTEQDTMPDFPGAWEELPDGVGPGFTVEDPGAGAPPVFASPPALPAALGARKLITSYALWNRFAPEERKLVRRLAKTDEDVEDFVDMANKATYIDLDDPALQAGVNAMCLIFQAQGICTRPAERATAILSASIAEKEAYGT